MKKVAIGGGQGFWGDSPDAAVHMINTADIQYMACDYLAELTLSIMAKQQLKDPKKGYAPDFVTRILKDAGRTAKQRNIRLITNAGGMNIKGCVDAIRGWAQCEGLKGYKIGYVTGDDIKDQIPQLLRDGWTFPNLDGEGDFTEIVEKIYNCNAYIGHEGIEACIDQGADTVITGRAADSALFLAPLKHELGWAADDWDSLARGIMAGHLLECGGQGADGNYMYDWRHVPRMDELGFPIAELTAGTLELTKAPDCGGVICEQSTKEQFLYEVLDPANYITPDVVVDVSGAAIRQQGENRVRVEGIRGRRRPDTLKLCVGYHKGWKTVSMLSFAWPDAYEKARYCAEVIMKKMARIGGVFYSSDELAMGGLRYFYEAEVPIPGQVKLIALGYNSLKNTELSIPALSVIDIPIERAAERCLTILTRLMRYEKADPSESESIISEYIPRESCPGVSAMSNKFKQNLFAAAAVTLRGSAIPVTKMIGASVSPFGMSAVKCLIAAVLLGAAAMTGKARRPSGRRELLLLLAASLSGFSLYMVSSTIGMMTTPASTASIIASLSPIMTAVGAVAFYRQRISAVGWAAIAAVFAGVLVIVLWNGELVVRPGILWLLLSVALFSAYSLLVPLLGGTFTANEIVTYAMIGAAVVLAPFLPQAAGELWAAPAYVRWLMLYMGVFPGCAAYLLWSGAFALAENSGDVANYMYLTPVTSTAAAFFLLGEVPDAGIYIGGAVIILSVVVFSLKGERKREDAA